MMGKMLASSCLAGLICVSHLGVIAAQAPGPSSARVGGMMRNDAERMPTGRVHPREMPLKVSRDPRLPGALVALHQRISDRLTLEQIKPPAERIQFFEGVIHPTSDPVIGWHGYISSVDPIDGGVLVTLRITANQHMMINVAHIFEQYSIVDNQVHFFRAIQPDKQYIGVIR